MQLQTEENISVNHQLNSGTALQLFRICQEAITNACKHSEATTLKLKAAADEKQFTITISDNGKGFDAANKEISGHYGLMNMEERAKESNLNLSIQSLAGTGTTILVSVPS
jgi:signal transduction histidine kinase